MSIVELISNAGIVVKIVMIGLALASVYSWGIIVSKIFLFMSVNKKVKSGIQQFESASSLREALQRLGQDTTSPLYTIAQHGVNEFNRGKEHQVNAKIIVDNVRRSLHQGVNNETAKLHHSISILATCSNAAPFIGLFGTVWGILTSFTAIGTAKSATLATVAPGIAEALVATAIGLFVAIPASIAFNIFISKLGFLENSLVDFAGTFLNRVQRELNSNN